MLYVKYLVSSSYIFHQPLITVQHRIYIGEAQSGAWWPRMSGKNCAAMVVIKRGILRQGVAGKAAAQLLLFNFTVLLHILQGSCQKPLAQSY